jgi:hypothetical protein
VTQVAATFIQSLALWQDAASAVRIRHHFAMISPIARYGLWLALACAVAAPFAGIGYRLGWWPLSIGFGVLKWAAYGAIAATAVGVIGAFVTRPGTARRGFAHSLAAVFIGIATFGGPALMLYHARQVPPIHDVTTDTANPPAFVAVLPLRAGATNSPAYGGPKIAALQRAAFPHIVPFESGSAPEVMFARALAAARDAGWTIQAEVPAEGRIEATATTLLFGFKDDVVIRIAPTARGSRVDIRSESRIGGSDLGTNARRVESFLDTLARSGA